MTFTIPIFTKLADAQRYYMHNSYTEFHPDLIMIAESMEIYQFTTLREVWLSLHQFSRNSIRHYMEIFYTKFPIRHEAWTVHTEIHLLPTEKTVTQLIFTKLTPL
jgi:hypothetical protein